MATQKQFDLVRSLLALAKSPFPAEAAAARKKADELILKFGITKADLTPPTPPPQRRRCPGCPNCRPMRARVVRAYFSGASINGQQFVFNDGNWIRFDTGSSSSTTAGSNNW